MTATMKTLPEQQERTHTLTIEVPLHLDADNTLDYDPIYETLRVVLSVSRMALDGVLCDFLNVRLDEVTP